MIPFDEVCRRNARALWVPCVAFGAIGLLCLVMMIVKRQFGWRAWAGTAFMLLAAAGSYRRIGEWRAARRAYLQRRTDSA